MESLRKFIRKSNFNPELQKICIDQRVRKSYCILERIQAECGLGEQKLFLLNTVRLFGGCSAPGEFCVFYSYLRLGTVCISRT